MEVSGRVRSVISPSVLIFFFASHQFLRELDRPAPERTIRIVNRRVSHTRTVSSPNLLRTALLNSERQPLLTRRRSFEDQVDNEEARKSARVAGGTILGIHNLAIVFPQFLVSVYLIPPYPDPYDVRHSQRLQSHQVQFSSSQMRQLRTTRRTPARSTGRMVSLGSFALADFALWYVVLCPYTHLLCTDIILAVRGYPVPYGASNPHGERDETSSGRDEGTQAGAYPLIQSLGLFSLWFQSRI